MHITLIAGARPNFMKASPIIRSIRMKQAEGKNIFYRLVHTGQHYDRSMSGSFFEELEIPEPDVNLAVGSGTQAEQTAAIMVQFEKDLQQHPTDLVIVVGDVNSTLACSIVTKKAGIKLAHVEAGIRSFDESMPEEINRRVTDSITDYFFTTSTTANENLKKEGIEEERIYFVGNVMIDTLLYFKNRFKKGEIFDTHNLQYKKYLVLTLHRPSNVDEPAQLESILQAISDNSNGFPIVFPVHPRTEKIMKDAGIFMDNIIMVPPMGYLEFNFLVQHACGVITDSGGITEETTVLGIPCMTLRNNTERPETCTIGTNELIGNNISAIPAYLNKMCAGDWKKGEIPPLWDGHASDRIVNHLVKLFHNK